MTCSKDSHDAEVLNCQQRCDNDAIKGSWKEEPGEQQRPDVCEGKEEDIFKRGIWTCPSLFYSGALNCHNDKLTFNLKPVITVFKWKCLLCQVWWPSICITCWFGKKQQIIGLNSWPFSLNFPLKDISLETTWAKLARRHFAGIGWGRSKLLVPKVKISDPWMERIKELNNKRWNLSVAQRLMCLFKVLLE